MDQIIYKALAEYCGDADLEIILGHLDQIIYAADQVHAHIIEEKYGITRDELIKFDNEN